jgi:hypothetical protein
MQGRIIAVVAGLVLAAGAVGAAPGPAVASDTAVRATLLPAAALVNEPVELTDLGVVVGNAGPAGDVGDNQVYPQPSARPWRWAAGRLQLLPTGGAARARVEAANRLGATAGWTATSADSGERAAAWDVLGRVRAIGVPAWIAADLNDRGDLVLGVDSRETALGIGILAADGAYTAVDPAFDTVPAGAWPVSLNNRRDVVFNVTGPRGTSNFLRWRPGGPPSVQFGSGWSMFNFPPCTADSESGRIMATTASTYPAVQISNPDGTVTPLPADGPAFPGCTGHELSETGDVVGLTWSTFGPDAVATPVLWRGGRLILLPGGPGAARAVNERGQIAGVLRSGDPVFWPSATATPVPLPVPAGWQFAAVTDVNNLGQVLGAVRQESTGAVRAILWSTG